MLNKKTIFIGLRISIILIFFTLVITGCGKEENGKTHIVIWHTMRIDERVILASHLKKYNEMHPDIIAEELYKETETLRSGYIIAAIAGQGPDLVYGPSDQVGPFQVMNIIVPLENLFDKEYLDSFNPKALTNYKGHIYQIADKLGNHLALVYNKDLVREPPRTDEELIAIGKEITKDKNGDGQPDIYGLTWNYTEPFFYIPFLSGFGGWVMDENNYPTLNTQANIDGLNFIQDLRDKYKIIPKEADYNIADMLFKEGKAGMIINGDWSWSSYSKAGINIGVAPLPKILKTGLYCAPMVSPKGFSINVNVKQEKIRKIIDLLKYLLDLPQQLETAIQLNTMPTRKALYDYPEIKNNEILKNSQIQIERGKSMPVVPELRAIWDAMRPNYQAVLNGDKKAAQAAKDMQDLSVKKINEMNE
jgi:arabinogalactan oligomer / maltooligosaccharide transport system permease protein